MKTVKVLICLCILIGCTKKENQPEEEETPAVPICSESAYSIYLAAWSNGDVHAEFFSQPQEPCKSSPAQRVTVKKVTVNGDSLTAVLNPGGPPYLPTYGGFSGSILTHETWSVTGANSIPSFAYTNVDSFPVIEHPLSLVDTLKKSTSFFFSIKAENITEGKFSLTSTTGTPTTFTLSPGTNLINIPTQQLSAMPGGYYSLSINAIHRTFPLVAGMNLKVEKVFIFSKTVFLK